MTTDTINPKKIMVRHIIIKVSKVKDKENFESSNRKVICPM